MSSRTPTLLLLVNAGSSSLKFSVVDAEAEETHQEGEIDLVSSSTTLSAAVRRIVADVQAWSITGVVHRIVHGGSRFRDPVLVDADVRAELGTLVELAPLHNPPGLAVLDAAMDAFPGTPQVAVFDTAFHATLSPEAFTYPVPFEWTERWALRRYGFHGLSHAYCATRAAEMAGTRPHARIVVAHLGSGASVTAIRDGVSIDTSMGFTPLEGVMMGTRCGSVDPGLLLHVQTAYGVTAKTLSHALNHESGLLGVSGVSSDMRRVIDAANAGDERAALAVRMFVHRARGAIGSLAVTLGGVDALVFTGGIGEHSSAIREAICEGLTCLGLDLDAAANRAPALDAVVSRSSSGGLILVVRTREDLMMVRLALPYVRGVAPAPASSAP